MTWTDEKILHACRTCIPGYDPWKCGAEFYFDIAEARRVIEFATECCTFTNSEWAGQRVVLTEWQVAFLATLFGWKRPDGTRRYRKALLFIAKKAGKTELAAIVANYLLFCDGEPSPEIVSAAGNAEQATKVFNAASKMVTNEPELERRAEVLTRSIRHLTNGGTYKVINAAAKTKHGGNLHAALVDELFVMDAELVDALETSTRARRQPLILFTTTAGDNPESIAGEVWDYASKIRDGVHTDDEFLPVIFEAPKDADPGDPATWRLAQPNLGVTVAESEYAKDYAAALKVPRKMATFRQFSLNQWTESAAAWISLEDWRQCGETFDLASLKGSRATMGIDLSSTTDTTAITTCIEHGGKLYVWADIFIPEDNAEGRFIRQRRDRAPYMTWIKQGFIRATPGNTVDYAAVENRILELSAMFDLTEVQADPYNASGLLERLIRAGLKVVTVRQGWSLAQATKEVERLTLARQLVHPNNPAFTYQVSSAAVKQDDRENQWITKARSAARVDAAVAMVMSVNAFRFSTANAAAADHNAPWTGDLIIV